MQRLLTLVLCFALIVCTSVVQATNFTSPTPDTVWYAGTRQTVEYDPSNYTENDTVTFFFDEDRSTSLAYGPATKGKFSFVVPVRALTLEDKNSSNLLGVFRRNFYLWKVDGVPVKVVMPPPNVTQELPKAVDNLV